MTDSGVVARFLEGVRRGTDPKNAGGGREAVTTYNSEWFGGDPCRSCGHSFRVDDPVTITVLEDGELDLTHRLPVLGCVEADEGSGTNESAGRRSSETVQRFFRAADQIDPVGADLQWLRLQPGDTRLGTKDYRNQCRRCPETIRPYEGVVVCPCGEGCELLVHLDLDLGLLCFDEMFPSRIVHKCPWRTRDKATP
jgi:hypothetical protein